MHGPSWLISVRELFARPRVRRPVARRRQAAVHHAEPLEGRRVMAFDFVAAFPNFGQFIEKDGSTILHEAPQQITIRFSPGSTERPAMRARCG
jgi:hypothetical protein